MGSMKNWHAIAAQVAVGVVVLATIIFNAGQQSQALADLQAAVALVNDKVDDYGTRLARLEGRLTGYEDER